MNGLITDNELFVENGLFLENGMLIIENGEDLPEVLTENGEEFDFNDP